jgi:Ca-activated chloride channel family protein
MAFDRPWLLAAAVLAALVWLAAARRAQRGRAARLRRFAVPAAWGRLGVAATLSAQGARRLAGVLLLGGVALAGPRWGVARSVTASSGIDMAIALDASMSMLAADERPSRLERMKQEVRRLRALAPSDRVALIAFAGRSYTLTPLTTDDGALQLYLDNLDPSLVGEGGSSVALAIRQATELLAASDGRADRALVVLSDGEGFDAGTEVEEAAREVGRKGIHLVTVGFGTLAGASIPVREAGRVAWKRDADGRVVVTRHHPELLEAAARAAGGEFIPATVDDKAASIRRAVRALRTARRASGAREELVLRVHWFLLPALLLLLWDSWRMPLEPRHRRRRRTAAPAALAAGVLIPGCARAPDPAALYKAGDVAQALDGYQRAYAAGDSSAAMRFNLGTAYLANDSLATAAALLDGARREADGEVRMRARFNVAVAALRQAQRPGTPEPERWLALARDALRALLRERPGDQEAKWNYELALRTPPGGGGGGGSGEGQGQQPPPEAGDASPPATGTLDARQAEALLNSAAREERDVQGRRQPRGRSTGTGRDW